MALSVGLSVGWPTTLVQAKISQQVLNIAVSKYYTATQSH